MLVHKDGVTRIDVVLRNYSLGDAYLHAQHLRDKYGSDCSVSYCIRQRVPEFKFSIRIKDHIPGNAVLLTQ